LESAFNEDGQVLLADEIGLRDKLQRKVLDRVRERLSEIYSQRYWDQTTLDERAALIALLPDTEARQHGAVEEAISKALADRAEAIELATLAAVFEAMDEQQVDAAEFTIT
jgi:hypothetical protein